jgi:hypothetical protein
MTTREVMEIEVCAVNSVLKKTVKGMDLLILLRNCHPANRTDFARTLHKENVITEEEMKEFTISKR